MRFWEPAIGKDVRWHASKNPFYCDAFAFRVNGPIFSRHVKKTIHATMELKPHKFIK